MVSPGAMNKIRPTTLAFATLLHFSIDCGPLVGTRARTNEEAKIDATRCNSNICKHRSSPAKFAPQEQDIVWGELQPERYGHALFDHQPLVSKIRQRLNEITGLPLHRLSLKATTSEQLGFTGRGEGIAALAQATVCLPASYGKQD